MLKIYASRDDDISEGFVWLKDASLPSRCVVKITNPVARRSVFCEALQIEGNFLRLYNQSPRFFIDADKPESAIVVSAWYRAHLGNLETQQEYVLEVANANSSWGKLRSCMQHPQLVVRVAVWLGLISVGLGGVSVLPYIISIWPRNMTRQHWGLVIAAAGAILSAFSVQTNRQYDGQLADVVDAAKRKNPNLVEPTETTIKAWRLRTGLALVAMGSFLQW